MPLRRLTSLIPSPDHVIDLGRRAIELIPGLPGARRGARVVAPPPPAPVQPPPKPKPAARPKPAAKPKAARAPKPKPAKAKVAKAAKPPRLPRKPAKAPKPDPHHALNNPVGEPDPTEYPDPYEQRPDPRDPVDAGGEELKEEPRSAPGAISTSEPPVELDPEAEERREKLDRDKLDQ